MKHTIRIPNWRPTLCNELLNCGHWGQRHRRKRKDAEMVAGYALQAGVPVARGKRQISVVFTLSGRQRAFDVDAWQKALLDACVRAGLLRDDSPRWCELGSVEYVRGTEASTQIVLEDIDLDVRPAPATDAGAVNAGQGSSRRTQRQ
jgi:Holliday junction resolvase RusA-like endonuclease